MNENLTRVPQKEVMYGGVKLIIDIRQAIYEVYTFIT